MKKFIFLLALLSSSLLFSQFTYTGTISPDDNTENQYLRFKFYNSGVPYHFTGPANIDSNVTIVGNSLTIENIPSSPGQSYVFTLSVIDQAGNESLLDGPFNKTAPGGGPDTIPPTLSNYRVIDGEPNKIYVDSSEPILANDHIGYTVNGNTIIGFNINSGQTTGHWFNVSSAFDYWSNSTIRYEGGSNIVDVAGNPLKEYTMQYIQNQIPEPAATTNKYVSVTGGGLHDGTSEANAWTITEAMTGAQAGDEVWIKAGDYGNPQFLTPTNTGTAINPIKFTGYKSTIGDITSMYYTYGDGALTDTEMPTFSGTNNDNDYLFHITPNKDYIFIKNIQATAYRHVVYAQYTIGTVIDNCLGLDNLGNGGNGRPFYVLGEVNVNIRESTFSKITNTVSINAGNTAFSIWGGYNLVDNCKSYSDRTDGLTNSQDYYFDVNGSFNIVRRSHGEQVTEAVSHKGHNFTVKSNSPHYECFYNLFELNYGKGQREVYGVRNTNVHYTVFKDSEAEGFDMDRGNTYNDFGLSVQSNANFTTFERIYVHDFDTLIEFREGVESGSGSQITATGTKFVNIIGVNAHYGFRFYSDQPSAGGTTFLINDTQILQSTFHNVNFMTRGEDTAGDYTFTNNTIENTNFTRVGGDSDPGDALSLGFSDLFTSGDYVNWYSNGFAIPGTFTNTISVRPDFIDEVGQDYTLHVNSLLKNAGKDIAAVPYDYINALRIPGAYSIGAYEQDQASIIKPETSSPFYTYDGTGYALSNLNLENLTGDISVVVWSKFDLTKTNINYFVSQLGSNTLYFGLDNGNIRAQFFNSSTSGLAHLDYVWSATSNWHKWILEWDNTGKVFKLYLDNVDTGAIVSTNTFNGFQSGAGLVTIGGAFGREFKGDIYGALIYQRLLTSAERDSIQSNWNSRPLDAYLDLGANKDIDTWFDDTNNIHDATFSAGIIKN